MKFRVEYCTNVNRKNEAQVIVRAVLANAESILSSRANGAEVEIVIEEPGGDWISNQWSAAIQEAAVDPNGGNDVYRFYHRVLAYARRHATIRGGGE